MKKKKNERIMIPGSEANNSGFVIKKNTKK
jgi:hypothetical protein